MHSLVRCSGDGKLVAVAQSNNVTVFGNGWSSPTKFSLSGARGSAVHVEESQTGDNADTIRDLAFSSDGQRLMVVGDDKFVRIFAFAADGSAGESQWQCTHARQMVKKVTSCAWMPDNDTIWIADKVGQCFSMQVSKMAEPLTISFGHFSLVTALRISRDARIIVTADRDEKIRVTRAGACFVIETFLFGHTDFVSCLDFASDTDLVSGGGDNTVRLFQMRNPQDGQFHGKLLATHQLTASSKDGEKPAVVALACAQELNLVAVASSGSSRVTILRIVDGALVEHSSVEVGPTICGLAFDAHNTLCVTAASPRVAQFQLNADQTQFEAVSSEALKTANQLLSDVDASAEAFHAHIRKTPQNFRDKVKRVQQGTKRAQQKQQDAKRQKTQDAKA